MPYHQDVYNAMRGTLTKGDGTASMPHWDDLPEFVRSALLAVWIESENVERERCARLVESLPPGDGFGGLNRNDIASRIRNPIN